MSRVPGGRLPVLPPLDDADVAYWQRDQLVTELAVAARRCERAGLLGPERLRSLLNEAENTNFWRWLVATGSGAYAPEWEGAA